MATRRKIVSAVIADDAADVVFNIHGPADAAGKFPVVDSLTFNATSLPEGREVWFALYGLSQIVSNRYNRLDDDATPADVRAAVLEVLDAVRDGSWQPGRTFAEREPTDLEQAIAEATGQPVRDVMTQIEDKVKIKRDENENPVLDADGNEQPLLDARGRKMRVFTQRMLDALAQDAKIKPILARLVAERARRLAADAKKGGGSDLLGSMFAAGAPVAPETAETAQQDAAAN